MTDPRHDELRRLFERALELPAASRASFLERVCGDDVAQRRRLEVMLGTAEDTEFLALPTDGAPAPTAPVTAEGPGARIGPYKLLRELGEGGFGVVFLAEQSEPVRRLVALKIVKLGMDTKQVVARFEQERQALALMDHPHIAKVLDAGATTTGRPYFVMDYVPGRPLTAFCDSEHLAIHDRLHLFAQVCQAVQHAHGKGIIHRDLKPSNVLVARLDGKPIAKVIDFGIAKATAQRLTDKTVFTEERQVIGTFQYMSPEQAAGSSDIDTRSDVYSLGVLLYELLTGSTPFDRRTLQQAMVSELQRLIREVDPPRPSTRLSESQDALPNIAALRAIEPKRLGTLLRGDLDWIVMKALEKDRVRRYETASDLAQDVLRHLAGEPVVAAPPSGLYRLRKVVRRHRGLVLAGSLIAASLVVGVVGFAWQARIAAAERNDAIAARNAEAQQRTLADRRAEQLAQVAGFQERMLGQIDAIATGGMLMREVRDRHATALEASEVPAHERNARSAQFSQELSRVNATDLAVRLVDATFLSPSVAAAQKQFADQPLVDATLRQTLATLYTKLGRYDTAHDLLRWTVATRERLLGANHADTLLAKSDLAVVLDHQTRYADAEGLYRDVLAMRRTTLGAEHPSTLLSLGNLGGNLRYQGKLAEAEPLLVEALAASQRVQGNEHRDTQVRRNQLGFLRIDQGRPADAEPLWREAYEIGMRVFGRDDPDAITWTNNLAGLYGVLGRPADAERLYREAWERSRAVLGNDHPSTWNARRNTASTMKAAGRLREAEPLMRETYEVARRTLGDEHQDTLLAQQGLGDVLRHQGRFDEAEALLRPNWLTNKRLHPPDHLARLVSGSIYASLLMSAGRLPEAEALYRELLAEAGTAWPPAHGDRLIALNNLANVLLQQKRPAEAEVVLREGLELRRQHFGDRHPETLIAQSTFARARENQGAHDEAAQLYHDATVKFREVLGEQHPNTLSSLGNEVGVRLVQQRFAEAEALCREWLTKTIAAFGEPHLRVAVARRTLGRALLGQQRFADAEAELLAADRMLLALPNAPSDRKIGMAESLQQLYETWEQAAPGQGHAEQAARWRAEVTSRGGGGK